MADLKQRMCQVTTVLLVLLFGPVGVFKVFPRLVNSVGHDLTVQFERFVRIPPLHLVDLDPVVYRVAVGITELFCASVLIVGNHKLQKIANFILVVIMIGALYTHYMVNDAPDKMGAAIVGLFLSLLRLYSTGYLKVKIG